MRTRAGRSRRGRSPHGRQRPQTADGRFGPEGSAARLEPGREEDRLQRGRRHLRHERRRLEPDAAQTEGGGGPAWSPDGTQIAFVSRRVPPNKVYVMNADGSDQHPVLASGGPQFVPACQPHPDDDVVTD
jgi:WD40-like Beta Propeller Repeat